MLTTATEATIAPRSNAASDARRRTLAERARNEPSSGRPPARRPPVHASSSPLVTAGVLVRVTES